MGRRVEWRKVLDAEVRRWQGMSCADLLQALREVAVYEVRFESANYQVEVQVLENTAEYVHVLVSVDDGSLPASLVPASRSFIRPKSGAAV